MALCHKEESILYGAMSQRGKYPLWRCVSKRRVYIMALSHKKKSLLYGAESHEDEYPLWC